MVEMKDIVVVDDNTISMRCIDDENNEFFVTFNPNDRKIIKCSREMDAYVYHAVKTAALEYKEGTLGTVSVSAWY